MNIRCLVTSLVLGAGFYITFADTGRDEWQPFAPRAEIVPECTWDSEAGRSGKGALKIATRDNAAAFGGWKRTFTNIEGGKNYRFTAWYRPQNIKYERKSIVARLEWLNEGGKSLRPPDYAIDVAREGDWRKMELITPVPEQARQVSIELALGFSQNASVWWDAIQLAPESSPPARVVRAVTIYCRPRNTKSSEDSVEEFCAWVRKAGAQKPDVICLPEGITVVGTGKSYADVSEPVPGPTCERLGELAKELNTYIVAGIYERSSKAVF